MPWRFDQLVQLFAVAQRLGIWLCASFAASAMICMPGSAQTPALTESATTTAVSSMQARANTEEVSIDLVVRDKRKRPVLDLTPAQIAVSDAGTPVQLSGFHLVTSQSGETVSVALLFDKMTPESAKLAREVSAKLLVLAPGQCSFSVLGVDRGLRLFQTFTRDRAAIESGTDMAADSGSRKDLTEAEKQLVSVVQTGATGPGLNASVEDRAKARLMLAALEESQRIVQDQHADPGLAGLEALAKAQQNLAGRKIIVFFSAGLRANSTTKDMRHEVIEAANRAGVGIYTVDTNGVDAKSFDVLTLMYSPPPAATVQFTPGVSGYIPSPVETVQRMATMSGSISDIHSTTSASNDRNASEGNSLGSLATGTGGFSIIAGGDVREPLKRLVGDLGTYYEASYTPALKNYDGQFHPIDIQPLRDGITIQSRAGYFALAPEVAGTSTVRPFDARLLKILSDSPAPKVVTFHQAVVRLGGETGRTANELAVEVPVSQLELRKDENSMLYSTHASILAQIKDKSGVVIERFSEDFSRNGALEGIEAAREDLLTMQRPFTAAPGDYALESAVLDRLGNKAGTLRTEFTIPTPTDDAWISDLTLVRRTIPMGSAPDPAESMQYAKARVVPNLLGEVPAGTPRLSFFFRIRPAADVAAGDGKLTVDIQHDGNVVASSSMIFPQSAAPETSVNLATLQTGPLAAGMYRAVFAFNQGGKTTARDLPFTVDANPIAGEDAQPELAAEKGEEDSATREGAADAMAPPAGMDQFAPGRFTMASLSTGVRAPSEKRQSALLASARERALGYVDSLVNFKCIEITDRFMDPKGTGGWPRHDKIAELVTFENHEESRTTLEVNGQPASAQGYDMKGARLDGEFGGVLKAVYDPKSKAQFKWKETDLLEGAPVQVFSYSVDVKNSQFSVTALPAPSTIVGFHGLVYIDDATRGTRRITMEAEGIPADSPVHASAVTIDYDYVEINDHDYLMPVEGEMRMKAGKRGGIMHRIEFQDYHRFGSNARIVGFKP